MLRIMKGYLFLIFSEILTRILSITNSSISLSHNSHHATGYEKSMQHDIEASDTLECILLRLHGGFYGFLSPPLLVIHLLKQAL